MHIKLDRIRRAAALIAVTTLATAARAEDHGWYLGAGIGDVNYAESGAVVLSGEHFAAKKKSDSDDPLSSSMSFSLGYRFNRYIALELGYLNNAQTELNLADDAGERAGTFWFRSQGETLAIVGSLPFGKWEPYAKLGVLYADTKAQVLLADGTYSSTSRRGAELLTSIGVGYNFTDHWQAKFDFTYVPRAGERTGTGQSKLEIVTLGFTYRF